MARPVEPESPPDAPPPPPADLLPDLQAKIELATRTLAILERRIAAWESELAQVRTELREKVQPQEDRDPARLADLEARVARIERRQMRRLARDVAAEADGPETPSVDPAALGVEAEDSRAIVFARWSSTEATTGETLKLSAMVDGFEPDEEITFTINALDGTSPCDPIVVKAGEGDTVDIKWKAPKTGRRKTAEFYFEATADSHVARSPVLTVSKA